MLIASGLTATGAVDAQSYPARPIRMVIPFSAGGATDVPGRIIAQKLSAALGQQVIIDNRPGAGGVIGSHIVAKAQPDGHTMLLTGTAFSLAPTIYHGKLGFDPLKDFAPVAQVALTANALVVHPSLPARSVKELIAMAQSQPGRIDYASSGTGGAQHLMAVLFLSMAKVNINHVAYKGSGPATADLLGGHVKVGFPGVAIVIPHATAGRLVPLGVTTARRAPQLPKVPTIAEAGVPGYEAAVWYGVLMPAGTPKRLIERMYDELMKLLMLPDVIENLAAAGYDIETSGPGAFASYIKTDIAKWGRVIKEARIQPE
jgi:tripartite-type tricarboxylate transporter receptor subunit TctC